MSASDGEQALRMVSVRVPDLILLDMLLPIVGGPEVLRALRRNPVTSTIPVIVLTSLTQKNEAKVKKDGATAYIEKSKLDLDKDPESLTEIVKKILEGSYNERSPSNAVASRADPAR